MENHDNAGCTPDKCGSCTGCSGEAIEKITLKVEWRHKGEGQAIDEVSENMHTLASELAVSGVELIYINNTFSSEIAEGESRFFINGRPLEELTNVPEPEMVSKEVLRKGIFQALLQNI